MIDRLAEYRRRRDAARTPEPVPAGPTPKGDDDTYVIQQHHARALHWDLRLERDGVLVSWALPRGLPRDPAVNHLAVHTEDHPLEYAGFAGEIPAGEYGGGHVAIYARGRYEAEKWRRDEVVFTLHGAPAEGRYALFRTGGRGDGRNWMIHRMDGYPEGWLPMPGDARPAGARLGSAPRGGGWAYELRFGGTAVLGAVDGGRLALIDAEGRDLTRDFPDLRPLGEAVAPTECLLHGEIAELGGPILLVSDLLWLEGVPTVDLPYGERRELLDGIGVAGPRWQVPPYLPDLGSARRAAADVGATGIVAKKTTAPYGEGWVALLATRG